MPTYAYRCDACGTAADEWLKMSEAHAERICPSCGQATYRKQLTAPAFQLKGGGWYVTDFRNGQAGATKAKPDDADSSAESKPDDAKTSSGDAKPSPAASDAKPAGGSSSNDASASSNAGNGASGGAQNRTPGAAA